MQKEGDNKFFISGFKASGINSGIKKENKKDLALIFSEKPSLAAAVFTTNLLKSASILLTQEKIKKGLCQAIVINSGNANTCTGEEGLSDARFITDSVARLLKIDSDLVSYASTGVIGRRLPLEKIRRNLPELVDKLDPGGIEAASQAIMTTDTFPKMEFQGGMVGGKEIKMVGIAKGSGMIMPNMATMLAFVLTDAVVEQAVLDLTLHECVEQSFNRITVDGDTSPNDMTIILANGAAENRVINSGSEGVQHFKELLGNLLMKLAKMIVRDGEGATKFIVVDVKGAKTSELAKRVAFTVANSSLVKTAFYGKDPNWGRIMAAVGRSGVSINPHKIDIYFDNLMVVKEGMANGLLRVEDLQNVLDKREIKLTIDLNGGGSSIQVFTSDLTHEYIKINAGYDV